MTKICRKCGKEKDGSDFHKKKKAKDGLHSWCKECTSLYGKTRIIVQEFVAQKECAKCKKEKPASEFGRQKSTKDGLQSYCRDCAKLYRKSPEVLARDKERRSTPARRTSRMVTQKIYNAKPEVVARNKVRNASPESKIVKKIYNATPKGKMRNRRRFLKRQYNSTPEQFDMILASQEGHCAICPATEPGGKGNWCVDHDHSCCTGKRSCEKCIRGLLCSNCNFGLGHFEDDPDQLISAANYITKFSKMRLEAAEENHAGLLQSISRNS